MRASLTAEDAEGAEEAQRASAPSASSAVREAYIKPSSNFVN